VKWLEKDRLRVTFWLYGFVQTNWIRQLPCIVSVKDTILTFYNLHCANDHADGKGAGFHTKF
jgi:hypothetical protein